MEKRIFTLYTLYKDKIKVILLLALSLLIFACENKKKETGEEASKPIAVDVITAKESKVTFTRNLPGRVTAFKTAEVRARVNGIIQKRLFEEGTDVKEGESLYKIEDDILKANVLAAEANVEEAKANYELMKITADRYENLYQKKAVSKQDRDTYAAQLKQSEAILAQRKAALDQQSVRLEYAKVKAPISGRIGKSWVTEGALASAMAATPFALIEQLDKVYIDFTQPHSEILKIKKAIELGSASAINKSEVDIIFDNGDVYPYKGELTFSDMAVDKSTGALSLRALVKNPDRDLLPGMYVRVNLPIAVDEKAIAIPQEAIRFSSSGASVYKAVDNKLVISKVNLGQMIDGNWIVESGVNTGDKIITSVVTGAVPKLPIEINEGDNKFKEKSSSE